MVGRTKARTKCLAVEAGLHLSDARVPTSGRRPIVMISPCGEKVRKSTGDEAGFLEQSEYLN